MRLTFSETSFIILLNRSRRFLAVSISKRLDVCQSFFSSIPRPVPPLVCRVVFATSCRVIVGIYRLSPLILSTRILSKGFSSGGIPWISVGQRGGERVGRYKRFNVPILWPINSNQTFTKRDYLSSTERKRQIGPR